MKMTVLKKVLSLVGLAIVALTIAVSSGHAQDIPVVGFLFANRSIGDATQPITLVGIRYTGECPGGSEASARSRFYSKTTRPAPELRAVVRNVSFGFSGDTKPFTDREYFKGDVSEGFDIRFGDEHKGKFLAVQAGENQFEYEIKRGTQVLEKGAFTASFGEKTIEQYRSARTERREQTHCRKYDKKDKHCIDEYTTVHYDRVC
jgi:hypothetical protein